MKAGLAPVPSAPIPSAARRREIALAGAAIVLAALAAYHNSFSAPFVLDDPISIVSNASIRHFGTALHPPPDGSTVTGRPVLNLSFAINYALGGIGVRGYHAVNLLIHILAGLALFGIVRRTLMPFRGDAIFIAWLAALFWTVHPLQTESVTYVVQRAESLMGLFFLLTLYCFVRGAEGSGVRKQGSEVRDDSIPGFRPRGSGCWFSASVLCCLLGMGTKEVMVSAPVMVLLYDRTFVGGSFRESWRRRRIYYLALAATWLPLAWLVAASHSRNNTAGPGVAVPWRQYALTQFPALAGYLELAVWPQRQIFDYGAQWVQSVPAILPAAAVVLALGAGSLVALWRRPVWGFFGFWFFAILAPSSTMPSVRQTVAEHRMYLALAPLAVAGAWLLSKLGRAGRWGGAGLAIGLAWLTVLRNEDYRSNLALWTDTVAKAPGNAFAQNNLGLALFDHDQPREAETHYRAALGLNPDLSEAHNNLGVVLTLDQRLSDAIAEYEKALQLKPGYAEAHNNLGFALAGVGRLPEAVAQLNEALRLKPDYADAHDGLGVALTKMGRFADAAGEFEEALRLKPGYAEAENGYGIALASAGQPEQAIVHYERALQLNPAYADAHNNLGSALMKLDQLDEAERQFEAARRIAPGAAAVHENLGEVLFRRGDVEQAVTEYEAALRLGGGGASTHNNLAIALVRTGRLPEALPHFQEAARLDPQNAMFHANFGNALAESGKTAEAITQYRTALKIDPGLEQVRAHLERLQQTPPGGAP